MSEQQEIQIFPHQQESSKVIGKTQTGNYIIKVHLLSNTETGNGDIYEYRDASEIPESFLKETIGLPVVDGHYNKELDTLFKQLEKEGKTDCEIRHALVEKSKDYSKGILDDVYTPGKITYNSINIPEVDLFGALEITDPVENKFIETHGRPSKEYTSIATFGPYVKTPDGKSVYKDLSKVRPFHIAFANNPAFGKHKAKVRGVCAGEKSECKRKLAFASLDHESINTDNNVINNMSEQLKTEIPNTPETKVVTTPGTDIPQEPKEVPGVVVKDIVADKPKQEQEEEDDQVRERPEPPAPKKEGNDELQTLKAQLEQQRKEIEDQKRTYRQDLLSFTIDPRIFKSEDELKSEKQRVMSIFENYNFNNEDAKWLVSKAYARQQSPAPTATGGEPAPKKPIYNSLFNVSDVTKSLEEEQSAPETKKGKRKIIAEY